jgi:uncharacterized protein (UPF0332 family)
MGLAMTSAEDKAPDAPVKPKRILPRGGKWPAGPGTPASRAKSERGPGEAAASVRRAARKAPRRKQPRANPADQLWAKAQVATRSAKVLLEAGDVDGAVNRAYYAAFSAARAALATRRASLAYSKGHATITRRLERHLIEGRSFDAAFGRPFFGRLGHARWIADYDGAATEEATARTLIHDAERFLAAVEPLLRRRNDDPR